MPLSEFVPGQLWLQDYPIHFAGCDFDARMAVIRVSQTELMIHSPCEIDAATRAAISALGEVAYIVAPGSYHHMYVPSAQAAFPDADTYICPGIERKRPDVDFDWFLGDRAPAAWEGSSIRSWFGATNSSGRLPFSISQARHCFWLISSRTLQTRPPT